MGKVHGSLARAGKVKSQTPKVRLTLSPITLGSSQVVELCPVDERMRSRELGMAETLRWQQMETIY